MEVEEGPDAYWRTEEEKDRETNKYAPGGKGVDELT